MNQIVTSLAKRRWLKRIIHPLLPEINSLKLAHGNLYYCVKDFTGPSFYVMFDGEKAFYHYEKINKDIIEPFLNDESVFFDIGANIGLFSFYFKLKNPNLAIHAFEPELLNSSCLEKSKESFKFKNFHINKVGLSDQAGEATLFIDPINMGGATLENDERDRHPLTIQIITLDEYVEQNNISRMDVIKIDVEGLEEKIIIGGLNSIRKYKPTIIFECMHNEVQKNNVVRALREFNLDFNITQVKSNKKIKPSEFDEFAAVEFKNGHLMTEYLITFA